MMLPVREKRTKEGSTALICPGEGCAARLGTSDRGLSLGKSLEPGYTIEPNERYRHGVWWRLDLEGRKRRRPRVRDLRKADKSLFSFRTIVSPPRPLFARRNARADRAPRVGLWSGSHIVVCYECDREASIEVERPVPPVSPR